jgi:hypothetical protein
LSLKDLFVSKFLRLVRVFCARIVDDQRQSRRVDSVMQTLFKVLISGAAFGAAIYSGASQAAVLPTSGPGFLGTFTGQPGSNSLSIGNSVHGTFNDLYFFDTTSRSLVGVSVTNKYQTTAAFISDLTISLYSALPSNLPNDPNLVATDTDGTAVSSNGIGFQLVSIDGIQPAGTYYFTVSGSTLDTPSYGGSLNITVSAVPLPASAPLFGAGLLALGIGGYQLKRRSAASV